jgi:hypothetical protein
LSLQNLKRDLEAEARSNWDEEEARREFIYAPSLAQFQVHRVERSPNQYMDSEGVIIDAEQFYRAVDWTSRSAHH